MYFHLFCGKIAGKNTGKALVFVSLEASLVILCQNIVAEKVLAISLTQRTKNRV